MRTAPACMYAVAVQISSDAAVAYSLKKISTTACTLSVSERGTIVREVTGTRRASAIPLQCRLKVLETIPRT